MIARADIPRRNIAARCHSLEVYVARLRADGRYPAALARAEAHLAAAQSKLSEMRR